MDANTILESLYYVASMALVLHTTAAARERLSLDGLCRCSVF